MRPAVGSIRPQIIFRVAVLPAPLGAASPKTSLEGDIHGQAVGSDELAGLARREVVFFADILKSNHLEWAILSCDHACVNAFWMMHRVGALEVWTLMRVKLIHDDQRLFACRTVDDRVLARFNWQASSVVYCPAHDEEGFPWNFGRGVNFF